MGNAKTTYFPESLEHLTYYNDLDIKIPSSVKYLCVNMLKENMVPSSLTHLKIYSYDEDITKFPLVTHLKFGSDFYGYIENKIPYGVKHITFGDCFSKIQKKILFRVPLLI